MDPRTCARCGRPIDEDGIEHRRRLFCSDECCEAYEDAFMQNGEPDAVDLEEPFEDLDPLDDDVDPDEDLDVEGELDDLEDDF